MAHMNDKLISSILLLNEVKQKTEASYVRLSASSDDEITIQIDWDDGSHTFKKFTWIEIRQASIDILPIIIEYANRAHKMILEGKL